MYKVVSFARYTPNKPKAESNRYWAEVHGPLFAKVPGIKRYIPSQVTGTLPAVGCYSGLDVLRRLFLRLVHRSGRVRGSDPLARVAAVGEDSANVFDGTWFTSMSAHIREVTQVEGASVAYKVVYVVNSATG